MSGKRQGRISRTNRKEEARIAKVKIQRAKEKPQRRQLAIYLMLISLLVVGGPIIVVVVSHQTGGHAHLPIAWLSLGLLLPVNIWAIYDWLK